jgi:predicted lysophospholipase L1 biosynthesis ABC-type transport system permease subunit
MTLADYSVSAFTVLNGARIFAYLPQIACVHRDRSGASSVSMMTWGMFFSANLATVLYALVVVGDQIMAAIFAANATACAVIFALILRKRLVHARRASQTECSGLSVFSLRRFGRFSLARALENRIASHYATDPWSDHVEREINREWMNHRCGRRPS